MAQFVTRVIDREPVLSEALGDIVKGSMLAASLYLSSPGEIDRRFKSTTLYLDTPLVLKVLGHEGERGADPIVEMVTMATRAGASVACLEHTVDEVRGVLHGAADVLRSGRQPPVVRGVLAHYLSNQSSASDVLERIGAIDEELHRLGIEIAERPPYEYELTIDETALREALADRISYHNEAALDYDIKSLTAIHRLRRGRRVEQIERSTATLVTDNASLVSAAQRFFRREEAADVGPAFLDHNLATLLWLKQPQVAPDLPLAQVVADSYALLDPGPRLWRAYMEEINRLVGRGEITASEVVELRFSIEAHRSIMINTSGDPEALSADVVREALSASRAAAADPEVRAREEAERQAESARSALSTAESQLGTSRSEIEELRASVRALQERNQNQLATIDRNAERFARRVINGALLALVLVGVMSYLAVELKWFDDGVLFTLASNVGRAVGVLSVLTLVVGESFRSVGHRMRAPLARWRRRHMRARLHIEG